MRTKGEQSKAYQTSYGEVIVNRHVYQRSSGGKTCCPLERDARIIITRAPLFAKQVSSKLAYGSAREVQRDLSENHARRVAVSYLRADADAFPGHPPSQSHSREAECGCDLFSESSASNELFELPRPGISDWVGCH